MTSLIVFLSGFAVGIGTVFLINGLSMIAFGKPFPLSTTAENDTTAVRWMGISEALGGFVSYLAAGAVLLQSPWLIGATLLTILAAALFRRLATSRITPVSRHVE
jgi:hypothetical protein